MKRIHILLSFLLIIGIAQLNAMKRDNRHLITMPEISEMPWLPSDLVMKISAHCDPESRANLSSTSKYFNAYTPLKNNSAIVEQSEFTIEEYNCIYYLIYGCIYNLKNLVLKTLKKFDPAKNFLHKEACYFIKQLDNNEATEALPMYNCKYKSVLDANCSVIDWAFDRFDYYNITQMLLKLILKSPIITFEQIQYTLENLIEDIDQPNTFLKERKHFVKLLLDNPRTNIKELRMSNIYVSSIVTVLLTHVDYNINQYDSKGNTLLHNAIINHKLNTIKMLLAHPDIDITLKNSKGETPLTLAIKTNIADSDEDEELNRYKKSHAIIAQLLLAEGKISHTQHYTGK